MTPDSDTPAEQIPVQQPRAVWLRVVLPHLITAFATLALAVAIMFLWPRPGPAVSFPPTSVPVPSAAVPNASPATVDSTPAPLAQGVARQEIADLKAEDARLWATVYLLKASSQVADAEGSLRGNDMAAVDQALIAADYSLSLAYERSEDAQKSPIDQFRRNVDRIRGDLYLYPERMDARLAQLRQLLLTLVDEPT